MAAQWIDLSAHNLALWRVGTENEATRRYVILPIFPNIPHTPLREDSSIAKRFQWNPDVQGYVFEVDPASPDRPRGLPALNEWLESFSGALIRDRSDSTFSYHQDTLMRIQNLPIANPWVWRSEEHPDRFFANQEQALADDGNTHSALCQADEVNVEGVHLLNTVASSEGLDELNAPVENLQEDVDTVPDDFLVAAINVEEQTNYGDSEPLNETDSKREDYGQYIPGARKEAYTAWVDGFSEKHKAFTDGFKLSDSALKDLEKSTRRDVIIGPLSEKLDACKDNPLKQAIWTEIYKIIPASVNSVYMANKKKSIIPIENRFGRIMGYTEMMKAVDRRMQAFPDHPDGKDLLNFIVSSTEKPDNSPYFKDFIPDHYGFSSWVPELAEWVNSKNADKMDENSPERKAFSDLLDNLSRGVPFLLSKMVKADERFIKARMMKTLLPSVREAGELKDSPLNQKIFESFNADIESLKEKFMEITVKSILHDYEARKDEVSTYSKWHLTGSTLEKYQITQAEFLAMPDGPEKKTLVLDGAEYLADYRFSKIKKALLAYWESIPSYDGHYYGDKVMYELPDFQVLKQTTEDSVYRNKVTMATFNRDIAIEVMNVVARGMDYANLLKNERKQENGLEVVFNVPDNKPSEEVTDSAQSLNNENDTLQEPDFVQWRPSRLKLPPETSSEDGYRKGRGTLRGDRSITEQELCETFGFRGIQYGQWMSQKDRQEHLDAAYDSAYDIQQLFDLSDSRMVGLPRLRNGENQPLGLALGARGRGRFKAHYEPDLHVINMTKTRGAGSFLHEWTHAMDAFYGSEITDGQAVMASALQVTFGKGGNPIADFVRTLKNTPNEPYSPNEKKEETINTLRTAHNLFALRVSNLFFSKKTQTDAFFDFQRTLKMWKAKKDMEKDGLDTSYGCQYAYLKAAEPWANQKANVFFEQAMPRLLKGFEDKLDEIESVLNRKDDDHSSSISIKGDIISKAKDIFVNPFYKYTSIRRMRFDEMGTINAIRGWMGVAETPEDDYSKESALSYASQVLEKTAGDEIDEEIAFSALAAVWSREISSSIFKKVISPLVNGDDDYTNALKNREGKTQFFNDALELGEYWSRDEELVARAVAAFGYDRLQEKGIINTYLTDHAPDLYADRAVYRADSDPQKGERSLFSKEFFEKTLPLVKEKLACRLSIDAPIMENESAQNDEGQFPKFMKPMDEASSL